MGRTIERTNLMHGLITFLIKYKPQLLIFITIFVAKEAVVVLLGFLLALFKREYPESNEVRVKRAIEAAEAVQKAIDSHEAYIKMEKERAAAAKNDEIDSFLGGK
jgi:outer membrane PBP1 activator LpoA protein